MNYATERATVDYDPATVTPEQLVARSRRLATARRCPRRTRPPSLRRRLFASAALSVPVLLLSMVRRSSSTAGSGLRSRSPRPVVLWGAWPFHAAAWENAKDRAATMDTLVSVGVLAAWIWSVYALFADTDTYFETASVITTFILAGRWFEARAKRGPATRSGRCSSSARRRRPCSTRTATERRVPVDAARAG